MAETELWEYVNTGDRMVDLWDDYMNYYEEEAHNNQTLVAKYIPHFFDNHFFRAFIMLNPESLVAFRPDHGLFD